MPDFTFAIGIVTPMRPVLPTRTCASGMCNSFASSGGHLARVLHALLAGAGVGVAGIHDDGLRLARLHALDANLHRRGANLIRREHAGDRRRHFGHDEREVALLALFEPLPVPRRLMSQNTPLARKPCGATIEPSIILSFCFMKNGKRLPPCHAAAIQILTISSQQKTRLAELSTPSRAEFEYAALSDRRSAPESAPTRCAAASSADTPWRRRPTARPTCRPHWRTPAPADRSCCPPADR